MDIEKKALELVRECVGGAVWIEPIVSLNRKTNLLHDAICRAIEAREADNARSAAEMEAFKREVSEAVAPVIDLLEGWVGNSEADGKRAADPLRRFIIPPPDPLVEAWNDAFGHGAGLLMKQECRSCRFYELAFCLRYPPTRISAGKSVYPTVQRTGWCGEYQPRAALEQGEVK